MNRAPIRRGRRGVPGDDGSGMIVACCDYKLGGQPDRCADCDVPCWDHPRWEEGTSTRAIARRSLADQDRRAIRSVVFGVLLVLGFGLFVWLNGVGDGPGADARDVRYAGSGAAVNRVAAMVAGLHAVEDVPVGGGGSAPQVASSLRPPGP